MTDLTHFYNDGTGWICKRCERDLAVEKEVDSAHARFFREGEAESRFPQLANPARAKWMDQIAEILVCPRCGVTEHVNKA